MLVFSDIKREKSDEVYSLKNNNIAQADKRQI
jgi:hypothetical protein